MRTSVRTRAESLSDAENAQGEALYVTCFRYGEGLEQPVPVKQDTELMPST